MNELTEKDFIIGISGSELEAMKEKLNIIKYISDHGIPFYAFGDNEAACKMNDILVEIHNLVTNS